ncbi:MAG: hypothetical protein H6Q59_383 [Firmicutes bacterium]|nr:hypothetical protein [Bacillota bacterium]
MNATHEIIEYNEAMPMKLFYQRIGNVSMHWHRSLELLFVLSGEMKITMASHHYLLREDDIIVINPNILHETYSEDCVLLSLQMRMSMFHLDWLTPESVTFACNSSESVDKSPYYSIKQILAQMLQANSSEKLQNNLTNYTYAFQLMNELVQNFKSVNTEDAAVSQKSLARLRGITDYMEAHFAEDITLTDVAKHEYMSPSYLSHFFEKHMGTTFSAYLMRIRLEHSLGDLFREDSIEEIADKNGFPSPRSYSTLFRKQYGLLPSEYRKNMAKKLPAAPALVEGSSASYLVLERNNYFEKLVPYLSKASAEFNRMDKPLVRQCAAKVSMSNGDLFLKHTFRNFCSVGRARELLYGDIQKMLRLQQAEMPFRYIKFHGIFDDTLKVYQEDSFGNPILNFYYTDKIIDFLLEVKLIPMIQLSFMPEAMAKYPAKTIFYYPFIISEPKEDSKWEYLVREFTKHVLQRYGDKQVNTWIFTFWNETLNDFPFDFPEIETSLRLYELSYKTVKALLPDVCFASTSHVLCDFPCDNYKTYLEYTKLHGCVPDAYLFNFYSTSRKLFPDSFGNVPGRDSVETLRHTMSSDVNQFHKNITSVQELFGKEPAAPIYITEWNFTSSHREWLNDTCFTSCYIVRNILQNYDKLDSFCHWSLTDLLEELPPDSQTFHGGMGFFTRDGIKKPAYYAYYLLTKLEDVFVTQQEGFFVTKNADGTRYTLMLYNYHHFSDIYGDGINFSNTFTERYQEFPTSCVLKYNLSMGNLKSGEYIMTQMYVNRNHGSVFDQWLRMRSTGNNNPMQLTLPEEIETLKSLSVPMLLKDQVTAVDGTLTLSIELEPHEIRLIQLELI